MTDPCDEENVGKIGELISQFKVGYSNISEKNVSDYFLNFLYFPNNFEEKIYLLFRIWNQLQKLEIIIVLFIYKPIR